MISVRLDNKLEQELERAARRDGVSKSDLIRRCISEFLVRRKTNQRSWELGKELFGKVGSGRSDLSENRKKIVKAKIRAKKNRD